MPVAKVPALVKPVATAKAGERAADAKAVDVADVADAPVEKDAVVEATPADLKAYSKRPLPMLNVWSRTTEDVRKCRSCIAGNFQKLDPAAQRWTAQAEPGSIFAAAKLAAPVSTFHTLITRVDKLAFPSLGDRPPRGTMPRGIRQMSAGPPIVAPYHEG